MEHLSEQLNIPREEADMHIQHALLIVLSISAVWLSHPAVARDEVPILKEFPTCMMLRLGPVKSQGGTREPDVQAGMPPVSVNYNRVFNRLRQASVEKGGNAVVLRGHRADQARVGARKRTRPSFVELHGTAIVLPEDRSSCMLSKLDTSAFIENALQRLSAFSDSSAQDGQDWRLGD